jgi:hypothetical protein
VMGQLKSNIVLIEGEGLLILQTRMLQQSL